MLSDSKKREDYDRFGSEEQRAASRRGRGGDFYEYDVGRGFEGCYLITSVCSKHSFSRNVT